MTGADLIAEASATPLTKSGVGALANAADLESLRVALARAVDEGHIQAATSLALAVGVAGGRIPAKVALRLIPDLETIEFLAPIAGIIEDRLTALLDVVDSEQLSWEREATVLYLATQLIEGEPPPRLVTHLRSLAREPIGVEAGIMVGLAARALKNPDVDVVAEPFLPFALMAEQSNAPERFRAPLFQPILDSLPETRERMLSGYTVVRTAPKVGRNDPCPCGSGRKYKKCCATREKELTPREAVVEQFQKLASHARVKDQLLETMRAGEIARLDPATLTTLQLMASIYKLTLHHRWDVAERFLEVLSTRDDNPAEDATAYRLELADEAIKAGELDRAERQLSLATLTPAEETEYRLRLAIARRDSDLLLQLEPVVRDALEGNHRSTLIEVAVALLQHYPALGILVARGCISAERFLDSEMLLSRIERARDRLGLPPHEPWWELFDLLLEDGTARRQDARADQAASRRHEEQLENLRRDLEAANARVSRLDAELEKRVQQLDSLTVERDVQAVPKGSEADERKRVTELEEESRRLRGKIAELKGEISEGAAQRSELRRKLAEAADLRRVESAPAATLAGTAEDDDAEDEEVVARPRKILVPRFTSAGGRALSAVPARVAAEALQESARLAAMDAHAWSGVKRMRRAHHVLSSRIGRVYRLLFELGDHHLDMLDLVHRRDLDAAIERLRS